MPFGKKISTSTNKTLKMSYTIDAVDRYLKEQMPVSEVAAI
jgi:hypothetical protein